MLGSWVTLIPLQCIMVKPGVSHRSLGASHDIEDLSELKEEELTQDERVALDRTVWRKLDRWVLPLCAGFILLSSLVCFDLVSGLMFLKCRQCIGQGQHRVCACGWLATITEYVE